jgi:hypothetical protein
MVADVVLDRVQKVPKCGKLAFEALCILEFLA